MAKVKATKATKAPAAKAATAKSDAPKDFVKVTAGYEFKNFQEGEVFEGKFVEFMEMKGKFGPQKRPFFKDGKGEQIVLPGHAMLVNTIEKNGVGVYWIKYVGKRKSAKGKGKYDAYDIYFKKK